MANYKNMTKTELIATLQTYQSTGSMAENEREQLLHELQVHQIELEMQNQELRETQIKLEDTGNLYSDLYDFAPVGYVSLDDSGCIREINLTGAAILGTERSALNNMPFAAHVIPSDHGKFRDHLWNCRQTKMKAVTEIGLNSKEGKVVQIELSSVPTYDSRRQITLYWTAFSDITERKRVEDVLQKTKEQLEIRVGERTAELIAANQTLQREITERKQAEENLAAETERLRVTLCSIGDGVITTDLEKKIVLMNKIAEDLTGWKGEEANGRSIDEVFRVFYDKTGMPYENLEIKEYKDADFKDYKRDIFLVSNDGTERLIAMNNTLLQNNHQDNIGMMLVFQDITKQRNMEDELLKTQKLESLGLLAGGIAHDFNNFLAAIMAGIQLSNIRLSKGLNIQKNLAEIEKIITQAANLTKQLLTFSKGGAPIKKTALIADLIKDTVDFTLHGSKLRCEFTMADDLWLAKVDEGQMSQVINNLVINAVQAMSEGGTIKIQVENVKLEARHVIPLPSGNYVKISIADQGSGIPEEYLPKIFDPYFTTKQNGNGLGLASSYAIIKKHNGYIAVQSELGEGTTFEIYLPASKRKAAVQKQLPELVLNGQGKILLMDDEASIRDATGEMLVEVGYEVALAADGAEAINLYCEALKLGLPFDVVITDLTIPGGIGGKELIATLLTIDPKVKAIISSGYSNDPVMADYREYGFGDLVTKPYKIEELHEKIHKLTQKLSAVIEA